jgi:hypothetical protein
VTLSVGGDCLADIAVPRAEPGLYGPVASDPTVSRTVDRLAAGPVTALRAITVPAVAGTGRWPDVVSGRPTRHAPHIAQLVAGHRDINTTMAAWPYTPSPAKSPATPFCASIRIGRMG